MSSQNLIKKKHIAVSNASFCETQFTLSEYLDINVQTTETFLLHGLKLGSESGTECDLFLILEPPEPMTVRVTVIVKSIHQISSVIFDLNTDQGLMFESFKTESVPYKWLSQEIFNPQTLTTLYISTPREIIINKHSYNLLTYYGKITSGRIFWEIKDSPREDIFLLKSCLETTDYHDLTIRLDDGKEFKVHKIVLAFHSPVFKNMIDSDMIEKKTGVIHIKDVEPHVMQEIVNFVYYLPCDLSKSPHNLFRTAHMYELNKLTTLCKNYMMQNIKYENFLEILKLVNIEIYDLEEVDVALSNFMENNESKIVGNREFIEYLVNNMHCESIHHLFKLCMEYDLNEKEKVIKFILSNMEKIVENLEFQKLILNNPKWSIEVFRGLKSKSSP